ncbi:MAG: tetratricopeptide repeat protein [Verrucomicrobiota bacterium]
MNSKPTLATLLSLLLVAALAGGCTKSARRSRAIERGDRYLAAGDYDKAEESYVQAVRMLYPYSPVALRQLGLLYVTEGRPTTTSAIFCLREASKAEPENVQVLVELAVALQQEDKFTEAKEFATRALKLQPGNERALMALCDMSRSPQETEQTRQYIEKLRQQDKDRASYHLAAGVLDAKEANFSAAESEFRKSQALDPNSTSLNLALANLAVANKDFKAAEQAFKTAADKAPMRSIARLEFAKFLFQRGQTNQATETLREINTNAPDYMPATLLLMQFSFLQRKYDDCGSYIAKILAREPSNMEALVQKGALSVAKGDGTQAVADYEKLLALYPNRPIPQIQFDLARACVLAGDRNKAIAALNRVLQTQTNYVPAKLMLADLEVRQGDPASAITLLTAVLKTPRLPTNFVTEASLTLASAYLAQNLPAQEAAVYQRLEDTFPKDAQFPLLAGQALMRDSQPDAARAAFEKSLALDPDSLPCLQELVHLDLAQAKSSDAAQRVKKQIARNPTNAVLWFLQADVSIAQRDLPQAKTALEKAISLDPALPSPYLMLARLSFDYQQQKEALEQLNTLVAITNDVPALMEIGHIHEMDKDYDLARQTYEKILSFDPQSGPALNNLACLYSDHLGQLDKASQLAQKAQQLYPDDPNVADTFGWILFKKREYPRALALEQASASKQPGDPEVQFHLGMAHYMMGEEDPARAALQFAAANTNFDGRDAALQRLAILAIAPAAATAAQRAEVEKQVQQEPTDPIAMVRLAALQERDGDSQKAAATYEAAIKQNPQNVRAMAQLAQIYSARLNQSQKGMDLAKNAHKLAPDDPFVSSVLGRLVLQARDYPSALSLLQAASSSMPGQPDLLHDLAWCYFGAGNPAQGRLTMQSALQTSLPFDKLDDAKQFLRMLDIVGNPDLPQAGDDIQQALRADTNYAPALLASALVLEHQGRPKDAEPLYEKFLAKYPLFYLVDRQLAVLYARDGNDTKASACADLARQAFPGDPLLAKSSGIVAYHRKDYQSSIQYLTQSSSKFPNDAELLFYLGMDYYQTKDTANSKKYLQRAVDLKLSDDLASQANEVLARLK